MAENVGSPGGDEAAFEAKPVVQVVGKVGVDAAEIRIEGRGIEADVLVTDGKIPAITSVVAVRGRRRHSGYVAGRGTGRHCIGRRCVGNCRERLERSGRWGKVRGP